MNAILEASQNTDYARENEDTSASLTVSSILSAGVSPLQPVQAAKLATATAAFADIAADILMW